MLVRVVNASFEPKWISRFFTAAKDGPVQQVSKVLFSEANASLWPILLCLCPVPFKVDILCTIVTPELLGFSISPRANEKPCRPRQEYQHTDVHITMLKVKRGEGAVLAKTR